MKSNPDDVAGYCAGCCVDAPCRLRPEKSAVGGVACGAGVAADDDEPPSRSVKSGY